MRVAALYDIHGNLPALEAVLDDVHKCAVDLIVIGGDVLPGPLGREALARLRTLDLPTKFIRGNGESAVLAQLSGNTAGIPAQAREIIEWQSQQLTCDEQDFIASWRATLRLPVAADVISAARPGRAAPAEVLFCHATPRNDTEIFTIRTNEERVWPAFEGVEADLVVCGHTHMQFDRAVRGRRIVNAGSVGMPFGEPGAYWLLLSDDVELRRTEYDLSAAADRIRASDYPQAEHFATNNIITPPTAEGMLDAFTKAELR